MLSASQLAQLIVSTRDLPAAADFYHRRLGLPLLAGDGAEVRVDAGGAEIRLCRDRFTSAAGGPPCVLVFLVDSLVVTQAALAAPDVACSPVRWHDVGALASVRDPDGHRIMLCQPSPAALDGPVGPVVREMRRAYRGTRWTPGPLIAVVVDEDRHAAGAGLYHLRLGLALLTRRRCCAGDGCRQPESFTVYDAGDMLW